MPNAPAVKLSDEQIAGYAKGAGFSGNALVTVVAIALAESSGNPRAHNGNRLTGDDSYGLMQINMLGGMGPERRKKFGLSSNAALFDPATNMRVAYGLSNGGKNFSPWSTYPGKSSAYLSRARKAAGNPDTSGGTTGVQPAGITDVFTWPGEILDFFEFITDPITWMRAGMIIAGGAALIFALAQMSGQVDKVKSAVSTATDLLPQTRGIKAAAKAV